MIRKARVIAALLCAAPLAAFAANDPWDAPFSIQIGLMNARASTNVRLDADNGRVGTSLSFEGDLSVQETKSLPAFDVFWRFNPYHALEGSFVSLHRDGERVVTGTINWGELTFPVDTRVQSKFDSDTYRMAYRYSWVHNNGTEWALLAGFHYTKMAVSLAGQNGLVASQEASVKYPLPTIGLRGSGKFADNWRFTGMAQLLKLKIQDYDGELYNFSGGVEWAFYPQMYTGLSYDYYKYALTSTKEHVRGEFDYRFDGPKLYFGWSF
jgi:hypothetical protein